MKIYPEKYKDTNIVLPYYSILLENLHIPVIEPNIRKIQIIWWHAKQFELWNILFS